MNDLGSTDVRFNPSDAFRIAPDFKAFPLAETRECTVEKLAAKKDRGRG